MFDILQNFNSFLLLSSHTLSICFSCFFMSTFLFPHSSKKVINLCIYLQLSSLPFDVLLTTYDIALVDQDFLSQIPWYYSIIDEAQRLKNPSSVCIRFGIIFTCICFIEAVVCINLDGALVVGTCIIEFVCMMATDCIELLHLSSW